MDIKYYTEPWSYAIVDNFLPQETFNELVEYCKVLGVDTPATKLFTSHFEDNQNLKEKIEASVKIFKDLSFNILNTPNKELLETNQAMYHLQFREPGHSQHPHPDIWSKVFSLVLYIYPFEGPSGTEILTPQSNYFSEVEWRPNRVIAFTPSNNPETKTYHAVYNTKEFNRAALVINYLNNNNKNEFK